MGNVSSWALATFLIALIPILVCWWWFGIPKINFAEPQNRGRQEFLTWWHVPLKINPLPLQQELMRECSISVYIHSGGGGTIEKEINLCWQTGNGPQRFISLKRGEEYFVPVALRSTHWKPYDINEDGDARSPLVIPPRIALLSDERLMLQSEIPFHSLINEYILSFHVRMSGKSAGRSGRYELFVPRPSAKDSELLCRKQT